MSMSMVEIFEMKKSIGSDMRSQRTDCELVIYRIPLKWLIDLLNKSYFVVTCAAHLTIPIERSFFASLASFIFSLHSLQCNSLL